MYKQQKLKAIRRTKKNKGKKKKTTREKGGKIKELMPTDSQEKCISLAFI